MKILHISTFDRGGALAIKRLHHALLDKGIESDFLCQEDQNKSFRRKTIFESKTPKITLKDRILSRLGLQNPHSLSDQQGLAVKDFALGYGFTFPETLNKDLIHHPLCKAADILHLHWVNGFIDYPSFFAYNTKPIVWTLHDLHPFTGGLFYSIGTEYQTEDLIDFIAYEKNSLDKIMNQNMRTKLKALENQRIKIIATTKKMKSLSEKSQIFRYFEHFHIPLALDTEIFKPYDQKFCRELFGLKEDKKVIVFVSADLRTPYKGLHLLIEALPLLQTDYQVLVIGKVNEDLKKYDFLKFTGYLSDEISMALAYSAGDFFVTPSLQEAFGQTTIEALACGLPVVAFRTWGSEDLVNAENGIIVEKMEAKALAEGIEAILSEKIVFDRQKIRQQAQKKYNLELLVQQHLEAYNAFGTKKY